MKMKIRKNIVMRLISALAIMCTAISMAVFPSYAENADDINSKGNIVLEDGDGGVALYAADADYLQDELDNLYKELPEISNSIFYGTARKSGLNSKGIIDYANGTVVIDSSDFVYLADEIDLLEAEYKANTVAALNSMGTFFLTDGSINHDLDDENSSETAAVLSFEKIYEGIKQSQSVEHLAEQDIAGAIEDNLSKGAAAWVNGELIIGNGADNDAYYENGYKKGYSDGYNKGSSDGYNSGYNQGSSDGYNSGYNQGSSDGYNKGVSDGYNNGYNKGISDGHADVVANPSAYGISTAPKSFCFNDGFSDGGATSYTCPTDGVYTFVVRVSYNNNQAHHNISNGVYLKIGSETLTIFHHYYENNNFKTVGSTYYFDTRTCAAGTVITLDVSAPYFTDGDYAYTCASMVIY